MHKYNLIIHSYYFEIKTNVKCENISLSTRTCNDVCIAVIYVGRFWKLSAILFGLSAFAVARIGIYLIHSCQIKPFVHISMTASVHKIQQGLHSIIMYFTQKELILQERKQELNQMIYKYFCFFKISNIGNLCIFTLKKWLVCKEVTEGNINSNES